MALKKLCKKYLFIIVLSLIFIGISGSSAIIGDTSQHPADDFPYDTYVKYLKEKGKPPTDYVIDKLKKYNIVMIGEDHWLKDHPQFISEVIKAIREDGSIELDYLAIEFGNAGDQPLADEFIASNTYREDLAIKILQGSADFCGWPYKDVLDILKTVWQENKKYPERKPIKILLTDNPYNPMWMDDESMGFLLEEQDRGFHIDRDRYMARILERKVIANDLKAIYYCGAGHSTYDFRDFAYNEETGDCLRYLPAGALLKILYPKLIFSIKLWGANMDRAYYPSTNPDDWDRFLDGKIDEVFRRNENKPVGFDITRPPFSNINTLDFFMFFKREKKEKFKKEFPKCYEKVADDFDVKLSKIFDGYIFLKPLEQYEGASIIENFFDDEFMKRISKRKEGKITTKKELYEYLLKIRPIMGKNLRELIAKEK
jgi:hypothetical protein